MQQQLISLLKKKTHKNIKLYALDLRHVFV